MESECSLWVICSYSLTNYFCINKLKNFRRAARLIVNVKIAGYNLEKDLLVDSGRFLTKIQEIADQGELEVRIFSLR